MHVQTFPRVVFAIFMLCFALTASAATKKEERAEVRQSVKTVLNKLYKANPSARKAVESSSGYAVFSNFGMKIFFAGGGTGKGIAFDATAKRETFMKMVEIQAGLGLGIKSFGLVFVFENPDDLKSFVESGWESSTQATAAATTGKKGGAYQGAVPLGSGIWLYQITDKGLALEATIKGTKYYKDDDLN